MSAADPEDGLMLSIVIAASNGPARLGPCLASLVEQPGVDEVIVSSNVPVGALAATYPAVRFEEHPAGTTVPMLRTLGIRTATGSVVALSEDNVTFDPGWAQAIRAAHAAGHEVVGGPVEQPDDARPSDWAVYFYEYGRFMPPTPAGATDRLPGNNVSYSRRILDELADKIDGGFYEAFLHEDLSALGIPLVMEPAALVHHPKTYPVADVLRQCYHHGRGYAGMRVEGSPPLRRAAWGAASLALPVFLPGRIAAETVRKGRRVGRLARALPYLVVFMTAWAAGEMTGYLAGPGESTAAWT